MEIIQQKIAHLKGLGEGLGICDSKDGKIYTEIIDIISDFDDKLQHVDNRITELQDYVDAIDMDLNDIENNYFEYDLNELVDNNFFEVKCPNCHEIASVEYDIFNKNDVEKILCPNCNEEIIMNIDVINEE